MDKTNSQNMLQVGTILHGTYKIESYLASGGFGNTYLAKNIEFDETYAIKEFFVKGVCQRDGNSTTISVSNVENSNSFEQQRDKFKKEARRLRSLSNPHIVKVYDLFEENGTAYYVMDYVDGENLSARLKRTKAPLAESEVRNYLNQILDGLEAIHNEGMFHLDIKPANIMVDSHDVVKLIDFGASKQQSTVGGATMSTGISYTNGYAPSEQMAQSYDKFGPWTDFYALGATVYKLLTNQDPPSVSDLSEDETEDKHLALPMPNVSEEMKKLVVWMMQVNRLKRPKNVGEIRRISQQFASAAYGNVEATKACCPMQSHVNLAGGDEETLWEGKVKKVKAGVNQQGISKKKTDSHICRNLLIAGALFLICLSISYYGYKTICENNAFEKAFSSQKIDDINRFVNEYSNMTDEHRKKINARLSYLKKQQHNKKIIDNLVSNMVYVEGGTFMMGGTDTYDWEGTKPVHQVTLSSFYIGKYEVTQEEWMAIMETNPSGFTGDKRPVEQVNVGGGSMDDCLKFIKKLNQITNRKFRLPTEAEWEYAARGGKLNQGYRYSGSNNISEVAWWHGNSGGKTHNVGLKNPNELGLYDMTGNVREYCSDWAAPYTATSQINPKGPQGGECGHIFRGGDWALDEYYCTVAYRSVGILEGYASSEYGFRLVMEP